MLIGLFALSLVFGIAPAEECEKTNAAGSWYSACPGGDHVEIGGKRDAAAPKPGSNSAATKPKASQQSQSQRQPSRPDTSRPLVPLAQCLIEGGRPCADYERPQAGAPAPVAAAAPTDPAVPAVTASDIASFRPADPTFGSDMPGIGIRYAPTNFVAGIAEHDVAGSLFGQPVTVRFAPAAFAFDYGDGERATRSTGGASWASLGQQTLTPTATSHVYREKGDVTAQVTVTFTAQVDVGDGVWRPVAGTVTGSPVTTSLRIYQAHTALVQYTCDERPSAPGCP